MSYELDNLWDRQQANFVQKAIELAAFAKACQLAANKAGAPVSKSWDQRIKAFEKALMATRGEVLTKTGSAEVSLEASHAD